MMDPELKRLMRNLEESINETLGQSPRINHAIREIKDAGYEVVLVIDATIGYSPAGRDGNEAASSEPTGEDPVRLRITPEDAKFLKSLKIAVDQER